MTTTTKQWAVLGRIEQNLAHDSYFYEITWDGDVVRVAATGATAYAGGFWSGNPAADPEQDRAARQSVTYRIVQVFIEQAQERAKQPDIGRTVRSLTTRGKNVGLTGRVTRMERENHYRKGVWRVEVTTEDGRRVWMDADRLEVTGGVPLIRYDHVRDAAMRFALNGGWPALVDMLGLF